MITDIEDIKLIPTSKIKYLKYPFAYYNPLQSATIPFRNKDINLVVAAPTSSGKTIVAEQFIGRTVIKDKAPAIYLSPLKAVTQEKHDDWLTEGHPFSKKRISIVTGDYQLTKKRFKELSKAEIILMTSEMLDSRTRRMHTEKNYWLLNVRLLVVDEAHLITMPKRGPALESGIIQFCEENQNARVILLSATMDNVDQLGDWMTKLNGKPTEIIKTDWRPIPLNVEYSPVDTLGINTHRGKQRRIMEDAIDLMRRHDEDKFLVFVHAKTDGRAMQGMLREAGIKCFFHNADLNRDSRIKLQHEFRYTNKFRILIATSTLAWGINLPARRVIVIGTTRGMNEVHAIDIKQEVGRAGRFGFDDVGDAHVLIRDTMYRQELTRLQEEFKINSQMGEHEALAFHTVAQIYHKKIVNTKTFSSWWEKTLASITLGTADDINYDRLYNALRSLGVIKHTIKGDAQSDYELTMLGKIAVWLYFNPYDVAGWAKNFNYLLLEEPHLFGENGELSEAELAWALGNVDSLMNYYDPPHLQDVIQPVKYECEYKGLRLNKPGGPWIYVACLNYMLSGQLPPELFIHSIGLKADSLRIASAVKMIAKFYLIKKLPEDTNYDEAWFDALSIRMRYGVPKEFVALCRLDGIGAKMSERLFKAGITTPEIFLETDSDDIIELIGPKRYEKALNGLAEK